MLDERIALTHGAADVATLISSAAMTETSFALFRIAGPLTDISCCGSCVCLRIGQHTVHT